MPATVVTGTLRAGCHFIAPRAFAVHVLGRGQVAPVAPGVVCAPSTGFGITVTWRFERLVGATWNGYAWPSEHLPMYAPPKFGSLDDVVGCKSGQQIRMVVLYRVSNTSATYQTAPVTCP